ncbi:hypothetical protein SUGI_0748160 [Cryptomeria japonica]|uniref:omega-hydroxypalmitate O-feruloyl transferase n=1 Tax=Cryptomeria japonica TaxID=3369 RepID=UPI002414C64C|nr:omega-hydroxypalmitate O-feruloyl transferase [Cryptomeria japonica]GLJ36968.1 hypothetical protein SUGI_0748160 [Cryptomeria japonica]
MGVGKKALITVKGLHTVLPWEPTPHITMSLSNLDTLPAIVGQMVQTLFVYRRKKGSVSKSGEFISLLRRSLAQVLVPYFPMSGRVRISTQGRLEICCNEGGVFFVEAQANLSLAELCRLDSCEDSNFIFKQFFYSLPLAVPADTPLLIVQVTRLRCGGHVMGVRMAHCVADGNAAIQFLNAWAKMARIGGGGGKPYFERSLVAPRQPPRIDHHHPEFSLDNEPQSEPISEPITSEHFHITKEAQEALKNLISAQDKSLDCTTFEAVGAHVWKCRTKALGFSTSSSKTVKFIFAVDVRTKLEPQLPPTFYGNAFIDACATAMAKDLVEKPHCYGARLIREAKKSITNSYVRSAIDYMEMNMKNGLKEVERAEVINASSWCSLPLYDVDFGWGKPFHVGPLGVDDMQEILFLPSSPSMLQGGLTVLLSLPLSAMARFAEIIHQIQDLNDMPIAQLSIHRAPRMFGF